jgi:HAMP domain-containing protein
VGLRTKLNLIIVSLFAIAIAISATIYFYILAQHAHEVIALTARLMSKSAHAARDYTVEEVQPLLKNQQKGKEFKKPAVSFYAAKTIFDKLQAWPDLHSYEYMLPTVNPTKEIDRALPYELEVIRYFISHPEKSEYENVYDSAGGLVLRLFEPIKVDREGCLDCHSEPAKAPPAMLAEYQLFGSKANNGFGWKMGDVVGAQEVSVPMSEPLKQARSTFVYFAGLLTGIFLLLLVLLNVLLHFFVIRPVTEMSRIANEVSLGKLGLPEYVVRGSDEIALLSASFNRMRRSLEEALKESGQA